MPRWFFTFGSDPLYPFQGGWVEIEAPTLTQAIKVFQAYWPDRTPGLVNCAFMYSEEDFSETDMYKGKFPNEYCHVRILYQA